jgi:type IV secretion system protein VirB10
LQSQAAAIASPIFASVTPSPGALKASMQGPTAQLEPPPSSLASEGAAIDPANKGAQFASPNRPEQKRAVLSSSKGDTDTPDSAYTAPTSAYEVKAGDIISAALVTALNSDLPGSVIAQVTRSVFDHATGEHLLIPQGARLFGKYDSSITYGQRRALVVWTRIIMPDGRSINIGAMEGADLEGGSGLVDRVDSHVGAVTRAIALSTAIVVGGAVAQTAAARSSSNLVLDDAAGGVSTQSSQVGQRFVDRDLNRQPTLQIRAGWPVTVIVNKDLAMAPY